MTIKIFNKISLADTIDFNQAFELLSTAKQTYWRYGDFSFSKADLEQVSKNFNDNVLGIEVAVDINHELNKKAYAWIKPGTMKVKESSKLSGQYSLYAELHRFTPEGKKLIETGAYRYFSVEISKKLEKFEGKVKKIFKNVISGLALTNAPVVKDMAPTFSQSQSKNNLSFNPITMDAIKILLAEIQDKKTVTNSEKSVLTKLFKSLSEEKQEELQEEVKKVEDTQTEEEAKEAADKEAADKELAQKKLAEEKAAQINLSETEIKLAEQAKELSELRAERKQEKVESLIGSLILSETNTTGFVADKKSDIQSFMLSLSEDQAKTFLSLVKEVKTVKLSAKGTSSSDATLNSNETLDKKAQAYSKENKVSYSEALKEVA